MYLVMARFLLSCSAPNMERPANGAGFFCLEGKGFALKLRFLDPAWMRLSIWGAERIAEFDP